MNYKQQVSAHAGKRMIQRGIPKLVLQWLLTYGATAYDHHGAKIHYFDKASRRRLSVEVGKTIVNKLNEFLDAYAVESCDSGTVLTTGYRYQRVWH